MNDSDRIIREEKLLGEHQKQKTVLMVTVGVTINMMLAMSVWLLKDIIASSSIMLVPATLFMLLYFVFSCYSVVACLGSEIVPTVTAEHKRVTTTGGKLLWWHGAAVLMALAISTVGGLTVLFVKALVE